MITMWHGGRGLQYSYREIVGNKSKQMEYGPGLYLTNFYMTAVKYAKGGGSTYKVTFDKGIDIKQVTLKTQDVLKFIKDNRFTNKKESYEYIKSKYPEYIPADNFLNIMIPSLTPSTSSIMRQFLVNHGIDYSVNYGYGGFGNQTIVVIFNPQVITDVVAVKSKDITQEDYELSVDL